MKKIINGRLYDTSTAKLIGSTQYSYPGDFSFWRVELYRKKTGEFFLYGEGGPMTQYAHRTGQNQWSGGEGIRPLTLREAREWAERYLDVEKYEQTFGVIEE